MLNQFLFATNHHAVTPLQAPHATACPYIHVVDPLRRKLFCAPDVIDVVGIAAIDEDVVGLEIGQKASDGFVNGRRRHH